MLKILCTLFSLHDDGTRHKWVATHEPLPGAHCCSFDYCRCRIERCRVCGACSIIESGVDECR
jgi:hypothetical protein